MSNVFESLWFGLLRLILTFLHLVYSGIQYSDAIWGLFKRKLEDVIRLQVSDTELYVSRFVTNLEKCPSHLAVIVGTEGINVQDFSNVVIWCIAAGISIISFYDHTGILKDNENVYYKYLLDKRKLDPKSIIFNLNKQNCTNGVNKNGFQKNGFLKKIYVNILSLDDGKPKFVKLVEKLSEKILMKEVISSEINEEYIDKELNKWVGFKDPELALVCGNICSTYGFLPWQIRVTEFLQVKSMKDIRVVDFTSMLNKYSSCHQRFGK